MYVLKSLLLLLSLAVVCSCKHDTFEKDNYRTVYFDKEILPIFQTNCAISGCHSGGNEFELSNYDAIIKEIKKGDPENSSIYKAITSVWGESMPPDNPLSLEQRTLIRMWILQGAQDNKAPIKKDTSVVPVDTINNPVDTTTPVITPESYKVCFTRDILPILLSNCSMTTCHDAASAQGDVIITGYTNISQLVSAKSPGASKLYQVITKNDEDRMPFNMNPLPKAAIDSIRNWIANGALNETCPEICDTSIYSFSGKIKPLFDLKCVSCHSSSNSSAGINLDNYTNISSYAKSGLLMKALLGTNGYSKMPKNSALDNCTLISVQKWIKNGAKND